MPQIELISAAPTVDGSEGLLAIVFRNSDDDPRPTTGPLFITPPEYPLQAAFMRYAAGHVLPTHTHPPQQRTIDVTAEVIIVTRGKLLITLYSSEGVEQRKLTLDSGDLIALYRGGHGFVMMEDTELIEVKQGPYDHTRDKILVG